MPRLRPLTAKDPVDPETSALLAQAEASLGFPSPSGGIQAYCPPILAASRALGSAPARSGLLTPELRGLAQLRAAQLVKCRF